MTRPMLWREGLTPAEEALGWEGWNQQPGVYYSVRALAAAIRLYNRTLLDVCRARVLDCIDLAPEVPQTAANFYDGAHYTEAGARLVAKVVSEHFAGRPPFLGGRTVQSRMAR